MVQCECSLNIVNSVAVCFLLGTCSVLGEDSVLDSALQAYIHCSRSVVLA